MNFGESLKEWFADKMSQHKILPNKMSLTKHHKDKMPFRHNDTGQKALQTICHWVRYHRTKCLADKISQHKMSCRQNVTGQNVLQNSHRKKCFVDKLSL